MGSELVGNSTPCTRGEKSDDEYLTPHFSTYTEQFYKVFPFYLAIGMTYDQFWNDDVMLVKYYKEAYEIKKKLKNEELWLQGMYFYEALCDVSPILHAFARRGTKPNKYPNQPYPINEKEHNKRIEEQRKKRVELMKQKLMSISIKK